MKAPVGLLSDRTVLRSKMEGLCPDKFRVVELSRVYHTRGRMTTHIYENLPEMHPSGIKSSARHLASGGYASDMKKSHADTVTVQTWNLMLFRPGRAAGTDSENPCPFRTASCWAYLCPKPCWERVRQTGTCRGKAPPSCYARPFCRLKAPLGLSLFCFAPQTRSYLFIAFSIISAFSVLPISR